MTHKNTKPDNRGFTLSEVLIAVAILIVLMGLAMIPITRHQRDLRQTELDAKAETVYQAAQNRLSQLLASGRISDCRAADAQPMNNIPLDAEQDKYKPTSLYYVTSDAKLADGSAAAALLPEGQLERQLWDSHWVVEFDPSSGSVYAVFYSEKPIDYTFDSFNSLRFRERRLSAGAAVGYYGGDSIQAEATGKLTPKMEIINQEQLLLRVTCDTPRDPLHFYVTISDGQHTTSRMELTGTEVVTSYRTYTATMTLDSLRSDMRFSQQKRFRSLTPGADLTIKVEVECESRLVDSVTGTLTTNSLFAEVRDGNTAVVTYARHLQNLEKASGLPASITRALQEQDIFFVNDSSDDSWDSLYGTRKFIPINNSDLTYFESTVVLDGQTYHPVIYSLPVDTTGDGGLFAAFHGTMRSIRLCGANIKAAGSAGALAGRLLSNGGQPTVLDGCQVYLSRSRDKLAAKSEKDIWLSGSTVGGLVGQVSYDLTITDSFAATVAQGAAYAGGLVGNAGSIDVSLRHSYADSYLYATDTRGVTGGLVGGCTGTTDLTLTDCYAAGFQSAAVTAGLIGGPVTNGDTLSACYSVCAPLGDASALTYSTGMPSSDGSVPVLRNGYYLSRGRNDLSGTTYVNSETWSGQNRANGVAALGSAFTAETGDTQAYNLMANMGLSAYSYPRLTGLTHYGDWQAEFESGALAYYERYSDGTYGFLGANRSTLKTTGDVTIDGYGMVFHTKPTEAMALRYSLGGVTYDTQLYPVQAIDMGGGYWLLPLPDQLVYTTEVSSAFYRTVQVDNVTYYYNPHFVCPVSQGSTMPGAPTEVGIRTARHLYDLSLYYDAYTACLDRRTTFQQERPVDYSTYSWAAARFAPVAEQRPIGSSDAHPFTHTYDGGEYTIQAPALTGETGGSYAGLFGLNKGTLRNIVLLTAGQSRAVTLPGLLSMRTAYIGTLSGRSDGTIYNCAVAGYTLDGDVRHGGVLYMGGLTGYNSGSIRTSAVSMPKLTASSLYASLYAGGFVGGNSSLIQQSYTMANVDILQISGGGVTLGGFAGQNTGSLRSSYCASSLTSPGADTFGFAPANGSVVNSYYLNDGTYHFIDTVHLYEYDDDSGAQPVNEQTLTALRSRLSGFGSVSAGNTYRHDSTQNSAGKAYPYPGVVTSRSGSRVHYGDWVTPADMGALGMLYWEYEEGGSHPGYHFSYIGYEDAELKSHSSLCTSHNDGGIITAYGYGYYWLNGSQEPTLTTVNTTAEGLYPAASAALETQMPRFRFVTYRTSDTGLRLTTGTQGNGTWYLSQGDFRLVFTVSPFFADAFALSSNNAPGTASKPYQVRSIEQLQYINWSYIDSQGSTTRDVTGSNSDYKYYPYLQYTNRRGNALQTKAMALAGDSTGGPRPILTWQQTHDLNGAGHGTAADGTAANYDFHPIAGAVNNGQLNRGNETYDLTLYNWFGGIYDGGNYYIKNVNITSHCYNVGLFGTTAGAEIKNIVLYSDNDAVIQRKTDATPASGATGPENYATSYALGGLVGIAYDYDENLKDKTKVSTISNCAIAGYTVTDNSKNRQFLGEAAIGGLVGVSSANLNRCSAVVKLNINCTHRYANTGAMNKAQWGNYVRVGGLVGGVRYDVSDCYTGGSITVASDLLNERILTGDSTNTSFVNRYETAPKSVKMTQGGAEAGPDTYVYIGGIGGSGFSATFSNFSGSKDGQPTYNNCYTYMTFPAMEGTITGISLIGSIADRAGVNGGTAQLTINNCYYLDSSAAISFNSLPTFYSKSNRTWSPSQRQYIYTYYSLATLLSTDTARMDMLRGDLSYLSKYTWNTGSSPYTINGLTALTYDQMSAKTSADSKTFTEMLNGDGGTSYDWVTIKDGDLPADGKYSFPGSAAALQGQNYPFPTVLTQETQYGTAHLHYGAWPTSGLYWSNGLLSLDRITTPTATLTLTFSGDAGDELPVITCARDDVVTVSAPVRTSASGERPSTYTVEFTGKAVGSTEVYAQLSGYTARMLVSVTSVLDITVTGLPDDNFFVGDIATLGLSVTNSRGETLTNVDWEVIASAGSSILSVSPVNKTTQPVSVTLTGTGEGEDMPLVTVRFTVNGETFTGQRRLMIPVRMQGVLGIANDSDPGSPTYVQGIMTRDGTALEKDADIAASAVLTKAPYTNRPAYTGAPLYLYSRGSAADGLTVSAVTVTTGSGAGAKHYDALSDADRTYRVAVGESLTDASGAFTLRPLTIKGPQTGPVTLTVTLTDAEGRSFTLSVPYTLTEPDTQVTATLRVGDATLTLPVTYGSAPSAEALSQLLADHSIPEAGILSWTPDITQVLYEDTAFTAVLAESKPDPEPTPPATEDADVPKDPDNTNDPQVPDTSDT